MSKYGGYMEVVSEVNVFLAPATTVNPIASDKNRVAKLSFSFPSLSPKSAKAELDKDGDLVLQRKSDNNCLEDSHLLIEYENSTSMKQVGLQVWRGAFLLADFVIHCHKEYFQGKQVFEVGSGTGLTAIVAAMYASRVTATDINDDAILKLLEINAKSHNKHLIRCDFDVRILDFYELNWSDELAERISNSDVVIAADVVYGFDTTSAFVRTLRKMVTTGNKSKDIFIAMEKRYIFTTEDMDTVAPMYAHLLDELDNMLSISPGCLERTVRDDNGLEHKLSMQFLQLDFPQYFTYERSKDLVLIHIKSIVG